MTTLAPSPELGAGEPPSGPPGKAGGKQVDRVFRAIALAAGLLVLAILALIAYATTNKAWPAFAAPGPGLLHQHDVGPERRALRRARLHLRHDPHRRSSRSCIAIPASLGIALFITELAPKRVAHGRDVRRRPARCDPFGRVRTLGARGAVLARRRPSTPTSRTRSARFPCSGHFLGGPASGVELHDRRSDPGRDDHSDHHVDQPRGADDRRPGRQERCARHGRDPVGDVARRGLPAVRSGLVGASMLGLGRAMGETITGLARAVMVAPGSAVATRRGRDPRGELRWCRKGGRG